jgi:hypothetical protein
MKTISPPSGRLQSICKRGGIFTVGVHQELPEIARVLVRFRHVALADNKKSWLGIASKPAR